MKKYVLFFSAVAAIGILAICCRGVGTVRETGDGFASFRIKRGTNIAHWLSQSRARGDERAAFITEKDIRLIDSLGFDHVRLPIDEEQMWDETGKRNEDAFSLMNNCLGWCRDAGLRVIIDLHILRSHHFNAEVKPLWTDLAEQDKFIALWMDLSVFLREWPNGMVAYEPMNEPVADDPEEWNILLARVVDSLRHREPLRVIVVGSNMWQSATTFDKLKVPENDTNLILSYHFYEPFYLTHYRAGWTQLKDFTGEVNYPGQIVLNSTVPDQQKVYNRDTLVKMMRKPLHLADSLRLPLYCGEFGVYMNYFPAAKLAWYRDMVSIFDEYGIAYANWNYKSGAFGIVDEDMKKDELVIGVLVGGK